MKQITGTIFLLLLLAPIGRTQTIYPADKDTVFARASAIPAITLDSNSITNLTNLGMLWGFIKYYHANVAAGKYNMDAELFRVLPGILSAPDKASANTIMEKWVDYFGIPRGADKTYDSTTVKFYPDYGYLFQSGNFSPSMVRKLNFIRTHLNTKDGHYYVSMVPFIGKPLFKHEYSYDSMTFNDVGLRLLALYRYWNAIQYFFPDRHLISGNWNETLTSFIPAFCKRDDTSGYYRALQGITACITDGHAINLRGGVRSVNKGFYTPITTMYAEGKLVVTNCHDTLGVSKLIDPGAIIEQIDGVSVDSLERKYRPWVSASNHTAYRSYISRPTGALFKTANQSIALTVRYADDSVRVIKVPTLPFTAKITLQNMFAGDTAYKILPGNIGYVYGALLKNVPVDSLAGKMKDTKGIVFDMRCYPDTYMPYTFGKWVKPAKSVFCRHTNMTIDMPGMCVYGTKGINGCDTCNHYKGRIVILVNERSQSASEYASIALASTPGAIVVGDTTAGADGDIATISLPGGGSTLISGIGVLYPDGTETQRVGVRVDRYVHTTVAGIRAHKDEQLDAAIKIIEETK